MLCTFFAGVLIRLEAIDQTNNQSKQNNIPINVNTSRVSKGIISDWVVGEGTALAIHKRHLFFQTSGKVVFIGNEMNAAELKEGSPVFGPEDGETHGQILARLDDREQTSNLLQSEALLNEAKQSVLAASASLKQAKATFSINKSTFASSQTLFNKGIISKSQIDQEKNAYDTSISEVENAEAELEIARSKVRSMQAALNQAKINVENTTLFAPFNGIIARLNISEGDYVTSAEINLQNDSDNHLKAPITVIDPGELEVTLDIPVFYGNRVKPGQHVEITSGGLDWADKDPESEYPTISGIVYSVSPILNAGGRTIHIKVRLKQNKNEILHGMFVSSWIEVDKREAALLIPLESLLYKDGEPYVYVVKDGHAQARSIKIGLKDEEKIEITQGLDENEIVVTKGRYRLHDGSIIKILSIDEA